MILKNTTVSSQMWGGLIIVAGGSYTIQEVDRLRLLADSSFLTSLASGSAVINEDGVDLSPSVGKLALKLSAAEGRFRNLTNGFTSQDIQSAIEEARNSSIGGIFDTQFIRQSSASNTWLYWGDSGITSDDTPFVVPFNARLVGVTFSNNTNNRDTDIRVAVSKATQGSTVDRNLTFQVRNNRTYAWSDFSGTDASFNVDKGDKVSVYLANAGDIPNDVIVNLYFKIRTENSNTVTENHSGSFSINLLGLITITIG